MSTEDTHSTFEQNLKKLESIIDAMESEKINLESLVGYYQEGLELISECRSKLNKAELLIEQASNLKEERTK